MHLKITHTSLGAPTHIFPLEIFQDTPWAHTVSFYETYNYVYAIFYLVVFTETYKRIHR